MTPARLEEVEKDLNRDTCGENDDHCAGCGQGMEAAHDLLAEVKRLRFELESARDLLDLNARAHQPGPVPVEVLRIIRRSVCKALAGEEPTP